ALLTTRPAGLAPALQKLLSDRAMVVDALGGLAFYEDRQTPRQILRRQHTYTPEARAVMIDTLSSRPSFAKALLNAVQQGKIQPREISAFHARQILAFEDAALSQKLTEVWGDLR